MQPQVICNNKSNNTRDSGSKQVNNLMSKTRSIFARLEVVGKGLLMYLTVRLDLLFGRLLRANDQIPLREDSKWKRSKSKQPWDVNMFGTFFSCSLLMT